MRLNKFIAHSGHCSRRQADILIGAGRVRINGKVIIELGTQIDPDHDRMTIDGQPVAPPEEKTTILLHKPTGYTTTKSDPHAEKTIYALLPENLHHLNPVGRLDRESEGLLLLTNDGDLAYQLTHPKNDCSKTYEVYVKGHPSPNKISQLKNGVTIKEEQKDGRETSYKTQPCEIQPIDSASKTGRKNLSRFRVTLHEGRKRQIRKMFHSIGHPVVYLKRISMGPFELGNLKKGHWKEAQQAQPPSH